MALLLTACGYAVGRFVNSPEQAWSVARQEVGRMKDMGILAPEVTLPEETYRVLELPEETTNDYWYGRIFKHRYNISAHGEKYFFNLDVDTATGEDNEANHRGAAGCGRCAICHAAHAGYQRRAVRL